MTEPLPSAAEIAAHVRSGGSAVAIAEQALSLIASRNPSLNCFTLVTGSRALAKARQVDDIVSAGGDPGPLAGVPYAVKNLFDVEDEITLAGSRLRAASPPATKDAFAVSRMEAAGAVLVGMLNMDEFAYGFTTENSHYGPTRNPHDPARIAGGSSGGSAAAVAGGMVPLSLGSDTNGSIRVPAALCGIFGLKPTYGRLGRSGTLPFVHSLDHIGPFAATVQDLALAYDALQGHDAGDAAYARHECEPASAELHTASGSSRAGVLGGWFGTHATLPVMDAVEKVATALAATTVTLPNAEAARAAAFCLTAAEGGSLHLEELRRSPGSFDPATRDRLIAGAMQPAHVVVRAQRLRRLFLEDALQLLTRFDVLIAAATPFQATPIGQAQIQLGESLVSVRANLGLYAQPLSFIGLPVLTVPVCVPGELPVGVQLVAAPWQEARLFSIATALHAAGIVGARPLY